MAVSPKQLEVEERGKDERQDTGGKASNESETEFKARDADGHTPRDEDEDRSQTADHEVTHDPVTYTLHVCARITCDDNIIGLVILILCQPGPSGNKVRKNYLISKKLIFVTLTSLWYISLISCKLNTLEMYYNQQKKKVAINFVIEANILSKLMS